MTTNWLPGFVFGRRPNMCVPIYYSEPIGKNSFSCCCRFSCVRFIAQERQKRTVAYISLDILGQCNYFLMKLYIRHSPWWPARTEQWPG